MSGSVANTRLWTDNSKLQIESRSDVSTRGTVEESGDNEIVMSDDNPFRKRRRRRRGDDPSPAYNMSLERLSRLHASERVFRPRDGIDAPRFQMRGSLYQRRECN